MQRYVHTQLVTIEVPATKIVFELTKEQVAEAVTAYCRDRLDPTESAKKVLSIQCKPDISYRAEEYDGFSVTIVLDERK